MNKLLAIAAITSLIPLTQALADEKIPSSTSDEHAVTIVGDDPALEPSIELDAQLSYKIADAYGAKALQMAQEFPGTVALFDGQYSKETIDLATTAYLSQLTQKPSAPAAKANSMYSDADIQWLTFKYRPIYRFSSSAKNHCTPITFSTANLNACSSNMAGNVPVYASYSFRKAENGGGPSSFWINYHVFYGKQKGWLGQGEHGDDWEVTSVLIVNHQASAVKYRVHGSAVATFPFKAARKTGDQIWVYPGLHFHGGYHNNGCPSSGPWYTWNDCRGDEIHRNSDIKACNFAAGNGDSCTRFPTSRNLWDEDTFTSKDSFSSPSTGGFDWQQVSDVPTRNDQICYYTEGGLKGIADCINYPNSASYIGKMFNDRISSWRRTSAQHWRFWDNLNFTGNSTSTLDNYVNNDRASSIRPN